MDTARDVDDLAAVRNRLGRDPMAEFEVVVRDRTGSPVVVRNAPFTNDGTPMPTRYWLVDPELSRRVSRLESAGGVREAAVAVDADELAAAHARYADERDLAVGDTPGPRPSARPSARPSGGVGGTRVGVKCLHAHFAWWLAGGDDPVGRWVHEQLEAGVA